MKLFPEFTSLFYHVKKLRFYQPWIALLILLPVALINMQCTLMSRHGQPSTAGAQQPDSANPPSILHPTDRQQGWPHTHSDLLPDPSLRMGRLANGFRYILKENHTPRDRVSMHLYVQAGSLNEKDDEQGIAHLLEHMLFNGSTHFPPGEMVKFFQRIGMQFGPDANAHTGFDRTVYDVVLPQGDDKSISEGLLVLHDYAQGALLLPEETEKEKKVVLAEMRTRDSADFRVLKESFQFEMPGGLIPRRFPIGRKEIVENTDHTMLRRFYETWYRPERMVLVMVGDFQIDRAVALIENAFMDIQARRPASASPDLGGFSHSGLEPFYRFESEMGATSVRLEVVEPVERLDDSITVQHTQLLRDLANRIMQRRLDALLQQPQATMTEADISSGVYLQHIQYADLSADCEPQYWRPTLAALEQELRRVLQYGFSQSEVNRVKKEFLVQLSKDADESKTRDSTELARLIMSSLGRWEVFQSPEQRLALLRPMVETVTAEQLHQSFRESWGAAIGSDAVQNADIENSEGRLILVTGNVNLSGTASSPREQILSAYLESSRVAVSPPHEKEFMAFPYLPAPNTSWETVEEVPLSDIGVTRISFSNGVQLLLKPTRFKENQVLMALSFGGGKASEPADHPGLAQFSEEVINASGFGSMDKSELETALAGHVARISLNVGEDQFVVQGETLSTELPLLVQLLYTFVKDPGFRPEAYRLTLKRYEQMYQAMSHTVEGAMRINGQRFLAGGDSRFGFITPEELKRLHLDEVRQWFGGQLAEAPLELAVVGDIEPQKVLDLVGRYFGSLPQRKSSQAGTERPSPVFPAGQSLELEVDSSISKSMVVVAYPTDDFWDISRTRRLNIMGEVYSERLREHIREKLGAAYSPYAYNRPYRAYPGFGLFQIFLNVSPHQAPELIDEVKNLSAELVRNGISDDEFRRAVDPTLTGIKDLRQTNTYWLNSVLVGASRHPQQLAWARTIEKDYAAINAEEIMALTRQYLDNEKMAVILIQPKTGE